MKNNETKKNKKTLEEKVEDFCHWLEELEYNNPMLFKFLFGTIITFIVLIGVAILVGLLLLLFKISIVAVIFVGIPLLVGLITMFQDI